MPGSQTEPGEAFQRLGQPHRVAGEAYGEGVGAVLSPQPQRPGEPAGPRVEQHQGLQEPVDQVRQGVSPPGVSQLVREHRRDDSGRGSSHPGGRQNDRGPGDPAKARLGHRVVHEHGRKSSQPQSPAEATGLGLDRFRGGPAMPE